MLGRRNALQWEINGSKASLAFDMERLNELQHSEGTFQLIVYGERLSGQDRVTVHLGVTRASVRVYGPTTGVGPFQTLTNSPSALNPAAHRRSR